MKKVFSIILSITLILSAFLSFPVFASAEAPTVADSGYCGGEGDGTNLSWTLYSDGTLTVGGSGAMFEKSCLSEQSQSPWFSKRYQIKTVIFEHGVTHVGNGFFQCENLQRVEFSETVESMSNYVFPYCFSLEEIVIPKNLTFIKGNPFIFCTRLNKITVDTENPVYRSAGNCVIEKESGKLIIGCSGSVIPDDGTVSMIAYDAFTGAKFKQITIPSSLSEVVGFSCCPDLESIVIPDGVTKINSSAFFECTSLESVSIPESVTEIGDNAFNYTAIDTVYYAGTSEQWDQIAIGLNNDVLLNADIHFLGCSHIPGEAQEDVSTYIAPTCTEDGKVDLVTQCTLCGTELSRETVRIYATNHANTITVAETEATYDAHGFTEGVFCKDCSTWISGHEVIHNTFGERTVIKEATENEPGEVIIVCTVCGERGLYEYQYQNKADESEEEHLSIGERIRKAVNSVVNWILRLISWLGGKKK